jgi:hypothetical protein
MIAKFDYAFEIPTVVSTAKVSIPEYLASLSPTPETELGPETVCFPTFNPLADCRRTGVELGLVNVEDAVNRIANCIEFFTNEDAKRIASNKEAWEIEGEFQLSDETIATIEEGIELMAGLNDPSVIEWAKPEINAVQYAKQAIITNNPWDVLARFATPLAPT